MPCEGPESSLPMLIEPDNARAYPLFFDYLTDALASSSCVRRDIFDSLLA